MLTIALLFFQFFSYPENSKVEFSVQKDYAIKYDEKHVDFYNLLVPFFDDKGKLFVFDGGVSKLYRFSKDGYFEKKFGKGGNGPGEFQEIVFQAQQHNFYAVDKRIFVFRHHRLMLFDYEGELLKEFKIPFGSYQLEEKKNEFILYNNYKSSFPTRKLQIRLSKDLENFRLDTIKVNKTILDEKFHLFYVVNKNHFFSKRGIYDLRWIDQSTKLETTLSRPFKRTRQDIEKHMSIGNPSKDFVKRETARLLKLNDGNYLRDVLEIVGANNKYLFVQNTKKYRTTASIDVFDYRNKKYLGTIDFKNIADDKFQKIYFQNGKFLCYKKNDSDGSYIEIYNFSLTKK
jgi:hypothetical protein